MFFFFVSFPFAWRFLAQELSFGIFTPVVQTQCKWLWKLSVELHWALWWMPWRCAIGTLKSKMKSCPRQLKLGDGIHVVQPNQCKTNSDQRKHCNTVDRIDLIPFFDTNLTMLRRTLSDFIPHCAIWQLREKVVLKKNGIFDPLWRYTYINSTNKRSSYYINPRYWLRLRWMEIEDTQRDIQILNIICIKCNYS